MARKIVAKALLAAVAAAHIQATEFLIPVGLEDAGQQGMRQNAIASIRTSLDMYSSSPVAEHAMRVCLYQCSFGDYDEAGSAKRLFGPLSDPIKYILNDEHNVTDIIGMLRYNPRDMESVMGALNLSDLRAYADLMDEVNSFLSTTKPSGVLDSPSQNASEAEWRNYFNGLGLLPGQQMVVAEDFVLSSSLNMPEEKESGFIVPKSYTDALGEEMYEGITNWARATFEHTPFKSVNFAIRLGGNYTPGVQNYNGGHWVSLTVQRDGAVSFVNSFGASERNLAQHVVNHLNNAAIMNAEDGSAIHFHLHGNTGTKGTRRQKDGVSCGVHTFLNTLAMARYGSIEGVDHLYTLIDHGIINDLESLFDVFESRQRVDAILQKVSSRKAAPKNVDKVGNVLRLGFMEKARRMAPVA